MHHLDNKILLSLDRKYLRNLSKHLVLILLTHLFTSQYFGLDYQLQECHSSSSINSNLQTMLEVFFPLQNPVPPTRNIPLFPSLFPTIVPLLPILVSLPNLIELSEEELRTMESNMRPAIQAKIQTLQRIQLLLDAANAMMNQYQTTAATANIPVNNNSASNIDSTSDMSTMSKPGTSGTVNTNTGVCSNNFQVKIEISYFQVHQRKLRLLQVY